MKLLLVGNQGSGKGTQGKILSQKYQIPLISAGELCRSANKDTEQGKIVHRYMNAGELVPDDIMTALLKKRLDENDTTDGFILDGYPRTLAQGHLLEKITDLDKVIYINISDNEVIKRITGRRTCSKCGAIYNVLTSPKPKNENICDNCNGALKKRKDATKAAVKKRSTWFHEKTEPLIDHYRKQGILMEVNGEVAIEELSKQILKELNSQ